MLFLLFLTIPLIEMYLLIEVGSFLGAFVTIGLVILTAMVGLALLRVQGFQTLYKGLGRFQGGELPIQELAEGLLLGVSGALLLTPGFLTDTIGFLLLVPTIRILVAGHLTNRISGTNFVTPSRNKGASRTFEGEFRRKDEDTGFK